jgi:homoserine O-succinyltransferase
LLGNTSLQVEVTLLRTSTHQSKNTPEEHLLNFYQTLNQISNQNFDGFIITGAPVEQLSFEEVDYWKELEQILDWGLQHAYAQLYICWGAQAALYHQYGIPKYPLAAKQFGVFEHHITEKNVQLLRGFDDTFYAPHSRHTEIRRGDIEKVPGLKILAESNDAGIYIVASDDHRRVYVTGHSEYDPFTLKAEYDRDVAAGLPISVPVNYYPNDDPAQTPVVRWRGHSHLLFANWINYYVYQETPYDLTQFKQFIPFG